MMCSHSSNAPLVRLFVVLLILVASPSWATSIPQFTLSDDLTSQSLPTLHWADASKKATPAQAKAALETGELITSGFSFPLKDAHHWFAVTLVNPTDHTITPSIYIKQAFPNIVNLHYQKRSLGLKQDKWVSLYSGTNIPLAQRQEKSISATFNLPLAANQEQTYYIETHSQIKLMRMDVKIGDALNSGHYDLLHITVLKLFIGAALILSIITMVAYVSLRDTLYLHYSIYIFSYLLLVIFDQTLDLFFELPIVDRSILYLSYNLVMVVFLLFVGKVLCAKDALPCFNIILKATCVVVVMLAGLAWYDFAFFSYTLMGVLILSVFILGVAAYAIVKGDSAIRLLGFGITAFISGVVIIRLMNTGLIPSNLFTEHAVLYGSLIEMVLFLAVLIRRIISLNEDRNTYNLALLDQAREARTVLEETVHERTLELQRANRVRGEFLATINHEMRTPLNGILGMVAMLQRKPSATEQEEQLDHLDAASRQLASLVDDVLDFSKIDENLICIQAEDFSTSCLVRDLTCLFSLSAKQKKIDLVVEAEVNDWLHGDMRYLKQVLINLMGNAIKFTQQGEVRLVIRPSPSNQNQSTEEAHPITFEVRDTGCGMEQSQLECVFSPYYQIQGQGQSSVLNASQAGNSGTGLGLAISAGLVKAMGGAIKITSEPGKGSCFSFELPLPTALAPQEVKQAPRVLDDSQNCFTGVNILLVEDSDINQNVIIMFLQGTGANINICETGAAALEHFQEHSADLILMDYRLPDTNGLQATKTIRAYEKQLGRSECQIIIHTADNRASLRDEAQAAGIHLILPKPFTQTQLINAIRQGLGASDCTPLKPNINPKLMPLLGEFVDSNLTSLQLCRLSLTSGDVKTLSDELHKCKGNAGLFGAEELHQTVLEMEQELASAPYDMAAISALLTQAQRHLKRYRIWSKSLE